MHREDLLSDSQPALQLFGVLVTSRWLSETDCFFPRLMGSTLILETGANEPVIVSSAGVLSRLGPSVTYAPPEITGLEVTVYGLFVSGH